MLKINKIFFRLAIGLAAVMCFGVNLQVHAVGMADPARDNYYKVLKGKRVVFVPMFMGLDLTEGWAASMKREADANGYKFEVRNSNWDTAAGAQTITSLITEKPDVIVVQNPDVQSYAKLLQKAEQSGIHVIQLNMKTNTVTDGFAGPDWMAMGEMQAKWIGERCSKGGSGKVAIVQGPPTAAASAYTLKGVETMMANYPKIRIVSVQSADWDASKAKNVTQVVLQQNPDLCGVIGFWDNMDLGTAAAIKDAGKTGKVLLVTSGGGARSACEGVQDGKFSMNVSYDVPGQGRDLNNMIKMFLSSNVKPGVIRAAYYTPLIQLTKEKSNPDALCWRLEDLK